MVEAVSAFKPTAKAANTTLGTQDAHFTLNGEKTFLRGIRYYGALAAGEEFIRLDLDDMQRAGFNWIRVWANWHAFGADAAAVDGDGHPIPAGMEKLKGLVACLRTARVDFLSLHRPRHAQSAAQTEGKSKELLSWMRELDRVVLIHYQEPFRRGYGKWNSQADDFVRDLEGAMAGGAAGWCFHNGDRRDAPDGQPRRSFDLREQRLFDQLDAVERAVVQRLAAMRTETPHRP